MPNTAKIVYKDNYYAWVMRKSKNPQENRVYQIRGHHISRILTNYFVLKRYFGIADGLTREECARDLLGYGYFDSYPKSERKEKAEQLVEIIYRFSRKVMRNPNNQLQIICEKDEICHDCPCREPKKDELKNCPDNLGIGEDFDTRQAGCLGLEINKTYSVQEVAEAFRKIKLNGFLDFIKEYRKGA